MVNKAFLFPRVVIGIVGVLILLRCSYLTVVSGYNVDYGNFMRFSRIEYDSKQHDVSFDAYPRGEQPWYSHFSAWWIGFSCLGFSAISLAIGFRHDIWRFMQRPETKRQYPFVAATLMTTPFFVLLVLYLTMQGLYAKTGEISFAVAIPLLHGLWWLTGWTPVHLTIVFLAVGSVVAAWFQRAKSRIQVALTVIYSLIMILSIAFSVWYFMTKPVFGIAIKD
jgi:hypothetical protein